ncbi:hypothetical protein F4Z98_03345 [Candidatus Poribacteria bacterium]|nr:hypothetical protein [Candidatus Poribacteria bacterium]MYA99398.1 hypothetical protein [Candidatus Poribacteria bacterium]MYI35251.1 hypothetical protein [Acidimicrobiaceae bacterium]
MGMLKSAEAYYSEIFEELCNSELAHLHDFNNTDVDHLIIEEIQTRIWGKLLARNSLTLLDPDYGDPPMHIDNWIKENPDSVEARTLLWIG